MTVDLIIAETAKAWRLPVKQVENIYWWVFENIKDPSKRSLRFVAILRREYEKNLLTGPKSYKQFHYRYHSKHKQLDTKK